MSDPLPGAPPHPPDLTGRLERAAGDTGPAASSRAHHRVDGHPRYVNRLALERSPYLLQHAHNPVDWWPWCDEAFAEARRLGRPVFLSVGYATCHWCHVMERESFEDEAIARVLNGRYVAIKVDREERPDVDQLYMTAVQLLTGGGGWPMSVWLTADREPFFGGTYFPPHDGARGGMRGFLSILEEVAGVFGREPERVRQASASLTAAVRAALAPAGTAADRPPGPEVVEAAVAEARRRFDPEHGGVRGAPKFPSSLPVRLLLRHHRRTGDAASLRMALRTLEAMAAGGIHDQLGGGFHRYSTDERWLVPHFEKMLYDNALLALAYAEAWQVTGRRDLARVARSTLDAMLRELRLPGGGLASATDADAEGEEGKSFVWTEAEIRAVLGPDADRFGRFHGVRPEGNWDGVNVLHVPVPDEAEWEALGEARARLLEVRDRRPGPLRDDKVIAAWNGLAISALAFGGRVLDEPRFVEAARAAAGFALEHLTVDGRLRRTWHGGAAGPPAYLDDHAALANGLVDLFEATGEPRWLAEALRLADALEALFGDPAGSWFTTATDHERLLVREKPTHDGAEPSGASVATQLLLRLAAFTGEEPFRTLAERALRHHSATLESAPSAFSELLLGVELLVDAPREVVLLWDSDAPPPGPWLAALRRTFLPSRALVVGAAGRGLEEVARLAPIAEAKQPGPGGPTAWICERSVCGPPLRDLASFRAALSPEGPSDPASR